MLLSILDLAIVGEGQSTKTGLDATVHAAQHAERFGYHRVWYAEHHNMPSIASSATSVLIAHVAAHTTSIRLGAGGVMLPNHAPLVIAEQYGTLATLHPGRIDLGLGRAPGTDPITARALRRDLDAADTFPNDVLELQGYLGEATRVDTVEATPGKGTRVPLYILGSSLFGARLAARLGLPYAFASHFAPAALEEAVALYRYEFRPSEQLAAPYVIAGMNVIASDTRAQAELEFRRVKRFRMKALFGRGRNWSDDDVDAALRSPLGAQIEAMTRYSAIGTEREVRADVERFAKLARADEVMTVHPILDLEARLRSIELLASAVGLPQASTLRATTRR